MHPLLAVAFFEIGLQRTVDRLFRVDGFLNALAADPRQPELERFGFRRRHRLHNAQKLFRVSSVGQTVFPVLRFHFQLLTICKQFIRALGFQSFFQNRPIGARMTRVRLIGQHTDHVHHGEIPCLFFFVPGHADRLVFKFLHIFLFHYLSPVPHIVNSNLDVFHQHCIICKQGCQSLLKCCLAASS